MLAIVCDKCRRHFTPTAEELRGYLDLSQGRKFAQVLCPHCGKGNKVGHDRINQALRFSTPTPAASETPASE